MSLPLIALTIPAVTSSAKGKGAGHKSAAKQCKAMRADMGADAFRAAFAKKGHKNAFGRCVSSQRKAKQVGPAPRQAGLPRRAPHRAQAEALRAREAGDGGGRAHARGCQGRRRRSASAEQAEDPEGFAEEYGPEEAFGKCVAEEIERQRGRARGRELGRRRRAIRATTQSRPDEPDEL